MYRLYWSALGAVCLAAATGSWLYYWWWSEFRDFTGRG